MESSREPETNFSTPLERCVALWLSTGRSCSLQQFVRLPADEIYMHEVRMSQQMSQICCFTISFSRASRNTRLVDRQAPRRNVEAWLERGRKSGDTRPRRGGRTAIACLFPVGHEPAYHPAGVTSASAPASCGATATTPLM